jgi:hypothetical protein
MLGREGVGKVFQVFVVGTFGGGGSGRWVVGGRLENGKGWKNSVMVVTGDDGSTSEGQTCFLEVRIQRA